MRARGSTILPRDAHKNGGVRVINREINNTHNTDRRTILQKQRENRRTRTYYIAVSGAQ